MKKNNCNLMATTFLKTAIALGIFFILLVFMWLIYLLLSLLGIIFPIEKENLNLVITIISTFGTAVYIYENEKVEREEIEREKQLDLLKILTEELRFLETNLNAYKKTFSGERTYPAYELWDIDVSTYLKAIRYKVKNLETLNLKKSIIKIKDKVLLLNNLIKETKELDIRSSTERTIRDGGFVKMHRDNLIKIIDEVSPLINNSLKEVQKILNSK
jgi:hypothetical protein